jgi:hypothetical protein
VNEGGFWHRPRYSRVVHAFGRHEWGKYSVRVGLGQERQERHGPYFMSLCGCWPQHVPAGWDETKKIVVPLEQLRLDRPRCPLCLELLRRLGLIVEVLLELGAVRDPDGRWSLPS